MADDGLSDIDVVWQLFRQQRGVVDPDVAAGGVVEPAGIGGPAGRSRRIGRGRGELVAVGERVIRDGRNVGAVHMRGACANGPGSVCLAGQFQQGGAGQSAIMLGPIELDLRTERVQVELGRADLRIAGRVGELRDNGRRQDRHNNDHNQHFDKRKALSAVLNCLLHGATFLSAL